jgi:hypothetical protein
MRRRFTAEERQRFVHEVRTTGASVKEVAARLGLDTSIGYRWMQAARLAGAPKFARLVVAGAQPTGVIAIEVGSALIRVETGFDPELLRAVVSSLSTASK